MLELVFNHLALLVLSAGLSFAALALWALRIGTRDIALAVFMAFSALCLLPYLVVPVVAFVAEIFSTAIPYLIVMALGQAGGVVAAFVVRRRRRPAPAPAAPSAA